MENKENGKREVKMTYYVAECMEFTRYGEYRENIKTAKEAVRIYDRIPPERLSAIKGIGVHITDSEEHDFQPQYELLYHGVINLDMAALSYKFDEYPQILDAVRELQKLIPDIKIIDSEKRMEKLAKKNKERVR